MKPRVLLDIGFLGHGFDFGSHQRGVHRVLRHLFDGLVASGEVDASFVATTNLAGAYDFLASCGIDPDGKLKPGMGLLSASRLNRRITQYIHRSIGDRRMTARAFRRFLSKLALLLSFEERQLTPARLAEADIYHSPHDIIPKIVRESPNIKHFLTIHDLLIITNPEYFEGQLPAKEFLSALTERSFAFCVSEYVRSEAIRLTRLRPEHVFVTPNAADRDVFYPVDDVRKIAGVRETYGIGAAPYFLALSSHDAHKNFGHIIRCFGELVLAGELKDYNLVIAGPNPQRRSIVQEAIAQYPAVKGRIIVTGFIAEEDLAAVYTGAEAFLFPSLAEGFGIPALEAMQCGTPVIGSNTSSIPEVVGEAGILLPPHDRDAWCGAMISLAGDALRREELGRKSVERAGLFSWQHSVDETIAGYKRSLEM